MSNRPDFRRDPTRAYLCEGREFSWIEPSVAGTRTTRAGIRVSSLKPFRVSLIPRVPMPGRILNLNFCVQIVPICTTRLSPTAVLATTATCNTLLILFGRTVHPFTYQPQTKDCHRNRRLSASTHSSLTEFPKVSFQSDLKKMSRPAYIEIDVLSNPATISDVSRSLRPIRLHT